MKTKRTRLCILIICIIVSNGTLGKAQHSIDLYKHADSITTLTVESKEQTEDKELSSKEIIGIAIPSTMIAYGIISIESKALRNLDRSIRKKILDSKSMWTNTWDDYLQYAPAAAAFGLKLSGVKSQHSFSEMFYHYALSGALEFGLVYSTKLLVGRERPNGRNRKSFPSGHTASAFMAAEFLHQEYKDHVSST